MTEVDQQGQNRRPADWRERQRALDPDTSFIVQAPAGSGKTGLLTQRFLTLLARVDAPEEIIAITFTRKAAAEMRNRILDALASAQAGIEPEDPYEGMTIQLASRALEHGRERDWSLLQNPGRLRIQTIDSLCQSLVRQMPLLSQFGAMPSLTDDAGDMYLQAAEQVLEQLESSGTLSDDIDRLLRHRDNRMDQIQSLIASMLAQRDQWLRHVVRHATGEQDSIVRRGEIEKILQRINCEALVKLARVFPQDIARPLPALAAFAAANVEQDNSPIRSCIDMTCMPDSDLGEMGKWCALANLLLTADGQWRSPRGITRTLGFPAESAGKDPQQKALFANHKRAMQQLLETLQSNQHKYDELRMALLSLKALPSTSYSDEEWSLLESLFQLLVNAVGYLKTVFSQQGKVDFIEMAISADHALGDLESPTDLSLRLDYRISHLLVDEFQDTSQNQYILFSKLTAGWTPGDGRTLFLVGDPMQSIYRFREAEVGLFLQAWEGRLGNVALEPLQLHVNFRSQAGIIDWVNGTFPQVFPLHSDKVLGAVSYAPSTPYQAALEQAAVSVYPALQRDDEREADQVCDIIEQCKQQAADCTIAVLVRSKKHVLTIARELQQAGQPYQAVEINLLAKQPVVQDMLSLTRAMIHPADRISWLAVLRAPWCGLTLDDLHKLAADDRAATVIELLLDKQRVETLSDDGRSRLQRISPLLEQGLARRGRQFLRSWIEGVWIAIGGPACLHSSADREDALVYLDLLQDIENEAEIITPELLEEKVSVLFARADVEEDSQRLQIMSMHKAKGLEFDNVILPGLGKTTGNDPARLLYWVEKTGESGAPEPVFAPISSVADKSNPIARYIRLLDREKTLYENGRLLYVAATRAKKQLHLLGHVELNSKNDLVAPSDSTLLHQLWPILEADYFQLYEHIQRSASEQVDSSMSERPDRNTSRLRLAADWACPPPLQTILVKSPLELETEDAVEFDWASESARLVGTVVHRQLEFLARHASADGSRPDWSRLRAISLQMLRHEGLPAEQLDSAVDQVESAIQGILNDQRGQWILSAAHRESHSEFAISTVVADRVVNMVIDRTFVDEQGTRWVIDYKTGSHTGGGLDEFLDREQERYRPQLEKYAMALANMEDRPIRLALYFPMMQGWREWSYS